jgi:hypothetical protein
MDASRSPIWFLGDLGDPWVVSIAGVLSESWTIHRLDCAGALPECPFDRMHPPRAMIVHRHRLDPRDGERLVDWRDSDADRFAPVLILCVSPYVRYEELERWSRLVDLVVSESTAVDVLPGHLARIVEGDERRIPRVETSAFRIEVACGDFELGRVLVEACGAAGYRVEAVDDREIGEGPRSRSLAVSTPQRVLTIWEVPVLEPAWSQRLERRALRTGPVIALAGFADRSIVARAKAGGAVACLELPCNIDDLLDVINRTVQSTREDAWPELARVEPPHTLPPPPRRRSGRVRDPSSSPWSDRGPLPRIPTP